MRVAQSILGIVAAFAVCNSAQAIDISKQPTQNMSCSAGVCTPTAPKAVLNVGDLTNMLASGDLSVQTGNGDDTSAGITIVNTFTWTNSSRLTLTARNNVTVEAPVTVAGNGAVTISYAVGNPNGDLQFEKKGKLDFKSLSSGLIINGNSYTLVSDIKTLAVDIAANASGFYALSRNYDASVDGIYRESPIEAVLSGSGTFEGLGHSIENLTISHGSGTPNPSERHEPSFYSHYLGLFYQNYGTIRDINLLNVSASSLHRVRAHLNWYQSTLTGHNRGRILHVFASGSVTGSNSGGLVGQNEGDILHSSADVVVSALYRAGGLVATNGGYFQEGLIVASHASGPVSAQILAAGGLVGDTGSSRGRGGAVDESFATGSVYVEGPGAERSRCGLHAYARRSMPPAPPCERGYAGGLLGLSHLGAFSNSYATGAVSADPGNVIGGFAGAKRNGTTMGTSYSTGTVSMTDSISAASHIGGFLGSTPRKGLENNYWDIDTSGQQQACGMQCEGVTGLTDAQLKSGLPDGFDPKIWGQSPDINSGYPCLLANPPPKGQ